MLTQKFDQYLLWCFVFLSYLLIFIKVYHIMFFVNNCHIFQQLNMKYYYILHIYLYDIVISNLYLFTYKNTYFDYSL